MTALTASKSIDGRILESSCSCRGIEEEESSSSCRGIEGEAETEGGGGKWIEESEDEAETEKGGGWWIEEAEEASASNEELEEAEEKGRIRESEAYIEAFENAEEKGRGGGRRRESEDASNEESKITSIEKLTFIEGSGGIDDAGEVESCESCNISRSIIIR